MEAALLRLVQADTSLKKLGIRRLSSGLCLGCTTSSTNILWGPVENAVLLYDYYCCCCYYCYYDYDYDDDDYYCRYHYDYDYHYHDD